MNHLLGARTLADYIVYKADLSLDRKCRRPVYDHIGALLVDCVLQAGLNYSSVVRPRVIRILQLYPDAKTISNLKMQVDDVGVENFLMWKHETKIGRFVQMLNFCEKHQIDNCKDLTNFFDQKQNHKYFISVNGVGPKTLDYAMKLLGFDTIAVDRHIINFIESAGMIHSNYENTKRIVEYAADILDITRSTLDSAIWNYMSQKQNAELELSL